MKKLKRCLSLLLAIALCMGNVPVEVHADFNYKCADCDSWYEDESDVCEECHYCVDCWYQTHCPNCAECVGEDYVENGCCVECGKCYMCGEWDMAEDHDVQLCDDCVISTNAFELCLGCHAAFEDMSENEYCVECMRCKDCWDESNHCLQCGGEDSICSECSYLCETCHVDEGFKCEFNDSHCRFINQCADSDEHCSECCIKCTECDTCYADDLSDFCEDHGLCKGCMDQSDGHCWGCLECFNDVEQCEPYIYCVDCCPDYATDGAHCDVCGDHISSATGREWCPTGGEESHCLECAEEFICEQCEECADCNGMDICDTCGLCEMCCEENTSETACECGMCVQESEFDEHLECPGCTDGLCASGEDPCEYCEMCVECCEANMCDHGICIEDEDAMQEHSCEECEACFDDFDFCDSCDFWDAKRCLDCCANETLKMGCTHGVCMNDPATWLEHWCFTCEKCVDDCEHVESDGEHSALSSNSWSYDEDGHWHSCRYCNEPEHRSSVEAHHFVNEKCTKCGWNEYTTKEPFITKQPENVTVMEPLYGEAGFYVPFKVEVRSLSDVKYQWERKIPAKFNKETNTITPASWIAAGGDCTSDTFQYYISSQSCLGESAIYRCRVRNEYGTVYSNEVTVNVKHNEGEWKYAVEGDKYWDKYAGMHWPSCNSCDRGDKYTKAEVHVGTWTAHPTQSNTLWRVCTVCGAVETRNEKALYITEHPKRAAVEVPCEKEVENKDDLPRAVFSVTAAHEVPGIIDQASYQWQIQIVDADGNVTWKDLSNSWYEGYDTDTLRVPVESEACILSENGRIYNTFRCVISLNGISVASNPADLILMHNEKGYDYLDQTKNNLWYTKGTNSLLNKHWPACSSCKENDQYELAEPHDFGEWKTYESQNVVKRTCEVCGYVEKYELDELHFDVQPENITVSGVGIGDTVELNAHATGRGEDVNVYYQWMRSEIVEISAGEWGMRGWFDMEPKKNDGSHTIVIGENACVNSQCCEDAGLYVCLASPGRETDLVTGKDVISTSIVRVIIEHNDEGTGYDETHHYDACSMCGQMANEESREPHEFTEWEYLSSTWTRSCDCGYVQTSAVRPYDASIKAVSAVMREPEAGNTPAKAAVLNTVNDYYVLNTTWYKVMPLGTLYKMTDKDVFQDKASYQCQVTFAPKNGYHLHDTVTGRLNENRMTFVSQADNKVTFSYTYTVGAPYLDITNLNGPILGTYASTNPPTCDIASNVKYSLETSAWYYDNIRVTGMISKYGTYNARLTILVKETLWDDPVVTIDGVEVDYEIAKVAQYQAITIKKDFYVADQFVLLNNVPEPVIGESAAPLESGDYSLVQNVGGCYVNSAKWYDGDTAMSATDTFAPGKTYRLTFVLLRENNAYFPGAEDINVGVNGQTPDSVEVVSRNLMLRVSQTYTTNDAIDYVAVGVVAPKTGAKPATTVTLSGKANYTYMADSISWYDKTSGKELSSTDAFEENHNYTVSMKLKAKDGFVFADPKTTEDFTAIVYGSSHVAAEYPTEVANAEELCITAKYTATTNVSGTITSFNSETNPVTAELIADGSSTAAVTETVTGNTANYVLDQVAAGAYKLKVSKADHVSREYNLTIASAPIVRDVKIHLKGDINGDGKVSAVDKKMIYNHINDDSKALTGYEFEVADVNGDSKISAADKKIIYNHISGTKLLWK